MIKKIWIAWEKHRRTSELAKALNGIKLFQIQVEAPRIIRYPYLIAKTILILIRERPGLVLVQNPSIILALFMVTLGKIFVPRVVVDAHNEGIKPFYSRLNFLSPLYRIIQKRADLTIVTNLELSMEVKKNGGQAFVLEDKIPEFTNTQKISLKGNQNVVFICTFEKDEPYEEVIKAARLIDPSIYLYITGRYQKAPSRVLTKAPDNVIFTGFLSEQDYANLLYSCDAIIDLTMMQNCLVCGGYEAVAFLKPLILSNTVALKRYFYKGVVYTGNTSEEIARAIQTALEKKLKLTVEMEMLKKELTAAWEEKRAQLLLKFEILAKEGNV